MYKMRKLILISAVLGSVAMGVFAYFEIGNAERLHSVYKPNYVEISEAELLELDKEITVNAALYAMKGHKDAIKLWKGNITILSNLVFAILANLVIVLLLMVFFGRNGSNKSLKDRDALKRAP